MASRTVPKRLEHPCRRSITTRAQSHAPSCPGSPRPASCRSSAALQKPIQQQTICDICSTASIYSLIYDPTLISFPGQAPSSLPLAAPRVAPAAFQKARTSPGTRLQLRPASLTAPRKRVPEAPLPFLAAMPFRVHTPCRLRPIPPPALGLRRTLFGTESIRLTSRSSLERAARRPCASIVKFRRASKHIYSCANGDAARPLPPSVLPHSLFI